MGCGASNLLRDDDTIRTDANRAQRPSNFHAYLHKTDETEKEQLLEEDCRRDEERVAQVGVGALVREALLRQKAKMLMLQIIMKFQEALEVRRRLARAVFERWRFVVTCRRGGVDAGSWAPPSSSKATTRAMKERQLEHVGDVITQCPANPSSNTEMKYLQMLKEDDLMRLIESQRQEAEAMGGKMNVKKLLASYGIGRGAAGKDDRICCKGRNCVIS